MSASRSSLRAGVPRALGLAAGLFALLAVLPAPARGREPAPPVTERPSIVLILTDDQRWDSLWAMPVVRRELGARGVVFENAFVVNPLCCPSRATTLTGAYSHTTGVYTNRGEYGGVGAFDDRSTIATWLQDSGYRTALIGRYMNGYRDEWIPPGWDRWFVTWRDSAYFDYVANDQGTLVEYGSAESDYGTDVLADEAVDFIRSTDPQQPLFLYLAPHAPHAPATPAPRHATAFSDLAPWRPPSYDEENVSDKPEWVRRLPRIGYWRAARIDAFRKDQYRTLLAVDEAVERVLQALADSGRLSNTMVLFASDNGYLWGEHRIEGKSVPYDEAIRVPYVLRYDPLTGGTAEGRIVANVDIAPTFADLAGVDAPGAEGVSLLPLLDGSATSWRADLLVEHYDGAGTVPTFCQVRSPRWSFVRYSTGEEELYELERDPYQLKNRAGVKSLKGQLALMRERARVLCDPLPPGMPRF